MPPPQEGLEAHARGLPLLGAIHTTFLPSKVCHLRPRRAVSAPGGVLGNLVDLNVSGRRAPGAAGRAGEYQKSPVFMPTNDGAQLVRGSGAEGGSRREFVPFGRSLVLSGLGVARMGRLACVFRALLCWGRCARD